MKLSRSERLVKDFLEHLGLSVAHLSPIGTRKTADFLATDTESNEYLIEVESQADDTSYWEELRVSGVVNRTDEVFRTNVATRVVRHATKQLRETTSHGKPFNLLAIVPASDDPGTQASEFRATLYGLMLLVPTDSRGGGQAMECFYFDYNEFHQMKDVEGALLFWDSSCQLCINAFAERAVEFRGSVLYRYLDEGGGILDPNALEASGQAYIADIEMSRSDPDKILDFLARKYSFTSRPVAIRPRQVRGAVRVDSEENGSSEHHSA